MIIPNNIIHVIQQLHNHNYEAFIVGGAVRDYLMGKTPTDYDITTNAPQKAIINIFPSGKIIGETFPVVSVNGIEIATYRIDKYDKPEDYSIPAQTLQEDLARRDFTINAMAYDIANATILDPHQGKQDIEKKCLTFVGEPVKRIKEHPIRIMRALRFASKLHLNITDETNNTIKEYGCMLTNVPFEAIRLELMKVLTIDHPSQFFKLLHHYNLLHIISSEFEKCINHDGGKHHLEKIFHHLMLTGDSISKKFPLIRLAGYLHDIGKPQSFLTLGKSCEFPSHEKIGADIAKHIMLKLKFSTNETNFVSNLVGFHMRCVNKKMTPRTIRRLIKDLYEKRLTIQDWMRLKIADRRANLAKEPFTLSEIKNILKKINKAHVNVFSVKDLVLSGNDIMNIMNISPGPMVGIVQKNLLDKVLDSPELNTRENLEKEVLKWNQ